MTGGKHGSVDQAQPPSNTYESLAQGNSGDDVGSERTDRPPGSDRPNLAIERDQLLGIGTPDTGHGNERSDEGTDHHDHHATCGVHFATVIDQQPER